MKNLTRELNNYKDNMRGMETQAIIQILVVILIRILRATPKILFIYLD